MNSHLKPNIDQSLFLKPNSTLLKFNLTNQDVLKNLQFLNKANYEKFTQVNKVGESIAKAIKNDDLPALESLFDKHILIIPLLKLFIDEAFLDALHLRYEEIIKYILENGYDVQQCQTSVLTVCYSVEYLKHDPPVELLELLLKYGANPNSSDSSNSMTGYHIIAQYGCVEFAEILEKYGGDHDAVDNNKKTPLNYAIEKNQKNMVQYLKGLGAKDTWKY